MKKRYMLFRVFVLLLSIILLSCSSGKLEPIDQLKRLAEDIREHHTEYSTSDWKDAYARYEQIAADMENRRRFYGPNKRVSLFHADTHPPH